jgi:protein TonB
MTNRVNWTSLVVFTLTAFALGCLAGTLVVKRHKPQSLLAAEVVTESRAAGDERQSTEVEIGESNEIAPPPATPALTRAPAPAPPRSSRSPRSSTPAAEMVYPVPLPAPITPSPANIPTITAGNIEPVSASPPSASDAVPLNAEPATPTPAVARSRLAPLEQPQRIRRVSPEYPRFARINNIEGTVVIAATIDTEGRVTYPRVVKSFPMFDQAALNAVQQWEFKPGTRGGQPVPVDVTLSVEFSLR